ncbi:Ig-like domain-containing protein [Pseudofrankia sp. DC12]|uniref:L,D-transpeptidase n=1 Tax=Pseudofrankia sp. DC12 TaxID=683315 RepID=UPI0005F81018|nr:Ig-like domain-containing protein [Pseudofrankia sp. DC12]
MVFSASEPNHRPGRAAVRGGFPRPLVAIVIPLLAIILAACGSGGGGAQADGSAPTTPAVPAAAVKVTPADGATGVAVTDKVVVTANAPLVDVQVARAASTSQKTDAGTLVGTYSADHRTWTSTGGLYAASDYQVTASTAPAAGVTGTTTSHVAFTTGTPAKQFKVSWEPVGGDVVGVGTPVVLTFSSPTTDRAAVQSRLSVTTTPALEGSWSWLTDRVVRWRPKDYYPSGTKVHVEANLAGLDAGNGLLGVKDRAMDFTIGAAQVSQVDIAAHTMKVYRNGQLVKTLPISGGKGGKPTLLTMDGPHNVIGKAQSVIMDSATVGIPKGDPDYYYETVLWNVQITSGGQYVHAAPWSVADQGRVNVSHGCVNAAPADAEWFYNFSQVGDIVNVFNSGRPPDTSQLGNDWSIPWSTWVAGSALPASGATPTGASGAGSVAAPASPATASTHPGT